MFAVLVALALAAPSIAAATPELGSTSAPPLIIADLDGDHKLDVAVGSRSGDSVAGFFYRIDVGLSGSAQSSSFTIFDRLATGLNVTTIDVDGDHDLDFVITSLPLRNPIGVWINDGTGRFERGEASLQSFFMWHPWLYLFLVPAVGMRMWSEERRLGTIELLLTAPLTDLEVVLGKFFAAAAFYLILLLSTCIPMAVLYLYGSPASGPILTAYLGLLLYGLAILAIGLFISTLTENQIIAAVLSFGTIMVLWLVDVVAQNAESSWSKGILSYLSILSHLDDFMKGILSTSHIIFYLSLMLGALFLTYRSIDSLRWRG